jgi:hypothetical protein
MVQHDLRTQATNVEYIVEPDDVPWKDGETGGLTFRGQRLLSGEDGGPEAIRFRFDPCPSFFAHMHLVSQFQLIVSGSMDLPKQPLRSLAVHYTDHYRPYGPFTIGAEHDMFVLHPRPGGIISMADREARKQMNLRGRVMIGLESEVEWQPLPGCEGGRYKILIPYTLDAAAQRTSTWPEVVLLELPPGTPIPLAAPVFGRYEVVLGGTVTVEGRRLGPMSLRYVRGEVPFAPFQSGDEGATVIALSFDSDALEGGLTGEGITVAAAEAMERAI